MSTGQNWYTDHGDKVVFEDDDGTVITVMKLGDPPQSVVFVDVPKKRTLTNWAEFEDISETASMLGKGGAGIIIDSTKIRPKVPRPPLPPPKLPTGLVNVVVYDIDE